MKYNIAIGEKTFETEIGEIDNGLAKITVNGETYDVMIENFAEVSGTAEPAPSPAPVAPSPTFSRPVPSAPPITVGSGSVTAPIPGLILDIKVKVGDQVSAGQTVATMEAMKMENAVISNAAGTVRDILVQKGSEIATGDVIMVIG